MHTYTMGKRVTTKIICTSSLSRRNFGFEYKYPMIIGHEKVYKTVHLLLEATIYLDSQFNINA